MRETIGYRLTEAGRQLLPQVEMMENASVSIEQSLPDREEQLSGQVCIGATEGYGSIMLGPQLGELARMRVTWDFLRKMAEQSRGRLMAVP